MKVLKEDLFCMYNNTILHNPANRMWWKFYIYFLQMGVAGWISVSLIHFGGMWQTVTKIYIFQISLIVYVLGDKYQEENEEKEICELWNSEYSSSSKVQLVLNL